MFNEEENVFNLALRTQRTLFVKLFLFTLYTEHLGTFNTLLPLTRSGIYWRKYIISHNIAHRLALYHNYRINQQQFSARHDSLWVYPLTQMLQL